MAFLPYLKLELTHNIRKKEEAYSRRYKISCHWYVKRYSTFIFFFAQNIVPSKTNYSFQLYIPWCSRINLRYMRINSLSRWHYLNLFIFGNRLELFFTMLKSFEVKKLMAKPTPVATQIDSGCNTNPPSIINHNVSYFHVSNHKLITFKNYTYVYRYHLQPYSYFFPVVTSIYILCLSFEPIVV